MKNILFVDDDTLLRFVLSRSIGLRFRDCNVLAASSGKEAVDILSSQPVHFVLTDVRMDDMDGFQLVEYMNAHHPEIPVAVMSADGGLKTKERLQALGVTKFFEKPFDLKDIQAAISDVQQTGQKGPSYFSLNMPSVEGR